MQPLDRSFYARPPLAVARDLLGAVLVHDGADGAPGGRVAGRIVETEAYTDDDPAMHGWSATFGASGAVLPVGRAVAFFGAPGTAYLYRLYGRSWLLNVVCLPEGEAGAVLIRAVEPLVGADAMGARRPAARLARDVTNGPGKLTEAMGIAETDPLVVRSRYHGHDLTRPPLWIAAGERVPDAAVGVTTRIGLSRGIDRPYRFVVARNPFVSRGVPSDERVARRTHRR